MWRFLLIASVFRMALATATEYEPVPVYVIEQSFTPTGGAPQSKTERHVGFPPWKETESGRRMPPQGFRQEARGEKVNFQGKEIDGERLIWIVDRTKGHPNHHLERAEIVRSDAAPMPEFMIPLSGSPDFPVPAGCVSLTVTPPAGDQMGISLTGQWKKETTCRIKNRDCAAHEFSFTLQTQRGTTEGTLVLTREVDSGIQSMKMRMAGPKGGDGIMAIVAVEDLPLPANLQDFPETGVGFAPPAGFERAAKAEPGELARFVAKDGRFIAVALQALDGKEFSKWWSQRTKELSDKKDVMIGGESYEGGLPVTSRPAAGYCDLARSIMYHYFERGGQGYCIAISGVEEINHNYKENQKLVEGWRWIKKKQ